MSNPPARLSRPRPDVWVITMDAPPDNRLTPKMIVTLNQHLDTVEAQWRAGNKQDKKLGGAVVLTSAIRKFFSNGFVPEILFQPGFGSELAFPFYYRLMTFPLITISAQPGHCFAGAMLTALCCDFRIMSSGKGWMSMNELLIGLALHPSATAILQSRINKAQWMEVVAGKRYTPQEALRANLVDELVEDSEDVEKEQAEVKAGRKAPPPQLLVQRAVALGAEHAPKVASGAWGGIKEGMFHHVNDIGREGRRVPEPAEAEKRFADRMARNDWKAML